MVSDVWVEDLMFASTHSDRISWVGPLHQVSLAQDSSKIGCWWIWSELWGCGASITLRFIQISSRPYEPYQLAPFTVTILFFQRMCGIRLQWWGIFTRVSKVVLTSAVDSLLEFFCLNLNLWQRGCEACPAMSRCLSPAIKGPRWDKEAVESRSYKKNETYMLFKAFQGFSQG